MEPFTNNMWDAELTLKEYGPDALVYPCESVFNAYHLSNSLINLRLLQKHSYEISNVSESIEATAAHFDAIIEDIKKEIVYEPGDEQFDVFDYLDQTRISVVDFSQRYDSSYLCWPVSERQKLEACFFDYPTYKFYENYMDEIGDGYSIFLRLIPKVMWPIKSAKIKGQFYWDDHSVKCLYEFENAVNNLKVKFNNHFVFDL